MLLSSLAPLLTTLVAWFVLGEALSPGKVAGIAAVVGGVAWVVSETKGRESWGGDPKRFRLGVALVLGSTALLAVSYVVSRAAMTGARLLTDGPPLPPPEPYSAAVIRVVTATLQGYLLLPLFGAVRSTVNAFFNPRLLPLIVLGATVGLVIGVWTAMITFQYAPSGVGSALMSLSPVFMIPLTALVFGERHTARAITGTVLATSGVVLLLI
jgi:drug/metabolite transporter (DMT)-like permease